MGTTTVKQIALSELREHPDNPRKAFDAEQLAELATSIKAQGLLQPLVVRAQNSHYQVLAGARRYRAIKSLRLDGCPPVCCTVVEADDATALAIMVAENQQRVDIHPLEEANGYAGLLKHQGWDVERIAAHVGKSASYVYQRLQLKKLSIAAETAYLQNNGFTAAHAVEFARLTPIDQSRALNILIDKSSRWIKGEERYAVERMASVRELRRWIKDNCHLKLKRAAWKLDDADLVPDVGSCIVCPKRTANHPALFADLGDTDLCTDPKCYQAKGRAQIGATRKAARADGTGKLIALADGNQLDGADLRHNQWKVAAKDAKGAVAGVVTTGPTRGRRVWFKPQGGGSAIVKAKLEPKAKRKPGEPAVPKPGTDFDRRWKVQDAERKLKEAQQAAKVVALVAAAPAKLTPELLHMAVAIALEDIWNAGTKSNQEALGFPELAKVRWGDGALVKIRQIAQKLDTKGQVRAILGAWCSINADDRTRASGEELARIAKLYKVDLEKLETTPAIASAEKRLEDLHKPKKAKAPKKPKGKKKAVKRKATKKAKKKPAKKK